MQEIQEIQEIQEAPERATGERQQGVLDFGSEAKPPDLQASRTTERSEHYVVILQERFFLGGGEL